MDLFSELKKTYANMIAAQGLFFRSGPRFGLRVECPTIGLEFTDNVLVGTDPEGFMFFDDQNAFEDETEYEITQITNPFDNRSCARIRFSSTATKELYAQFLAYDPADVVRTMQMNGVKNIGKWNELKIGAATAIVKKNKNSNTVVVEVDAIKMRAVFHDTKGLFPKASVRSHGMLSFKDFRTLKDGIIANYNKDRIVFYAAHATDFKAYFIPFEYTNEYINQLGDVDTEFQNVTWTEF